MFSVRAQILARPIFRIRSPSCSTRYPSMPTTPRRPWDLTGAQCGLSIGGEAEGPMSGHSAVTAPPTPSSEKAVTATVGALRKDPVALSEDCVTVILALVQAGARTPIVLRRITDRVRRRDEGLFGDEANAPTSTAAKTHQLNTTLAWRVERTCPLTQPGLPITGWPEPDSRGTLVSCRRCEA
jgi:hypothetical protein